MLECLRTESVSVKLGLMEQSGDGSWKDITHREGKHFPPTNEFISLRAEISNLSRKCMRLVVLGAIPLVYH